MKYLIVTTANARRDVQDAIDWENMRKPGLATRFLADLDGKLMVVSNSPYLFTIRYDNVRCALTDIFPYLIHYLIDEPGQRVIILRILHTSRKPVW